MKPLLMSLCLLMLGACSSGGLTTTSLASECRSVQCELDSAAAVLARACRSDLFFYPAGKRRQIDREYRYPLTNYDTFFEMRKYGFGGPSPQEWCAGYAAYKMQVQLPPTALFSGKRVR